MTVDRPAPPIDARPRSRRALLAAAAGGAAAVVATLARPATTGAAVGDPILAGHSTDGAHKTTSLINASSANTTLKVTQQGTSAAITAKANKGTAGRFNNWTKNKWALVATNRAGTVGAGGAIKADGGPNIGVHGTSTNNAGVSGYSDHHAGVYGTSFDDYGVWGHSPLSYGVYGDSQDSIGVYGFSENGGGVLGQSGNGPGVAGWSDTSYAGSFGNEVRIQGYLDMDEIATPTAPSANQARLFVRDDSAGKTQLCVVFPSGAVQVLATEP